MPQPPQLKAQVRRMIPRSWLWRHQPVRLYSWRGNESTGNFGDQLSKHLVQRLFDVDVVYAPVDECDLVGLGSILQEVEAHVTFRRPTIRLGAVWRPADRRTL